MDGYWYVIRQNKKGYQWQVNQYRSPDWARTEAIQAAARWPEHEVIFVTPTGCRQRCKVTIEWETLDEVDMTDVKLVPPGQASGGESVRTDRKERVPEEPTVVAGWASRRKR